MHKIDLCEECAQKKGVTNTGDFSMGGLMDTAGMEATSSSSDLVCESCGLTHQEFKKAGRFGCSACYEAFRAVLNPMLDGMHAGTRHVGKVPKGLVATVKKSRKRANEQESAAKLQEKILSLEADLQKSLEGEEFEDCARLRDEIRTLRESFENLVV
jgi:protein arginine kinase activator